MAGLPTRADDPTNWASSRTAVRQFFRREPHRVGSARQLDSASGGDDAVPKYTSYVAVSPVHTLLPPVHDTSLSMPIFVAWLAGDVSVTAVGLAAHGVLNERVALETEPFSSVATIFQ